MQLQANEHQRLPASPESRKRQGRSLPHRLQHPANTLVLDFWPPVGDNTFLLFLSHQVCGTFVMAALEDEYNTFENLFIYLRLH